MTVHGEEGRGGRRRPEVVRKERARQAWGPGGAPCDRVAAEAKATAAHAAAAGLRRTLCPMNRFSRKLIDKNINNFCYWLCKDRIWEVDSRDSSQYTD